jgi:hypothetical protein
VAVGVGDGLFVAVGTGVNVGGWDELQSVAASVMTCVVTVGAELAIGDELVGDRVDVVGIVVEQHTRIKMNGIRHDI